MKLANKDCTSLLILFFVKFVCGNDVNLLANMTNVRAKREFLGPKRYLVFPQGSNVQLVFCMTIGSYSKPQGQYTWGVTAGLAWELPHVKTVPYRKPAEVYHRRSRRDLYRKIEIMLRS